MGPRGRDPGMGTQGWFFFQFVLVVCFIVCFNVRVCFIVRCIACFIVWLIVCFILCFIVFDRARVFHVIYARRYTR